MTDINAMTGMIVQGFCVGIGSSIGNYFVLKVLLERLKWDKIGISNAQDVSPSDGVDKNP